MRFPLQNMGICSVQLQNSFTGNADGVLYVSQLPPNAAVMPPTS